VSAAGVVRGIHYADVPPGQAKYVTCVSGSALDVVVDLRVGSPTFGTWDAVRIDDVERRAVYLPEGVGHAFMALSDRTTIVYLCSENYAPEREHGIDPLDATLAIPWPEYGADGKPLTVSRSEKDAAAPSFAELRGAGVLPTMAAVEEFVNDLRFSRAP
jgi:dTDP-4-dehydrorhamnose 3,5-epimerase